MQNIFCIIYSTLCTQGTKPRPSQASWPTHAPHPDIAKRVPAYGSGFWRANRTLGLWLRLADLQRMCYTCLTNCLTSLISAEQQIHKLQSPIPKRHGWCVTTLALFKLAAMQVLGSCIAWSIPRRANIVWCENAFSQPCGFRHFVVDIVWLTQTHTCHIFPTDPHETRPPPSTATAWARSSTLLLLKAQSVNIS